MNKDEKKTAIEQIMDRLSTLEALPNSKNTYAAFNDKLSNLEEQYHDLKAGLKHLESKSVVRSSCGAVPSKEEVLNMLKGYKISQDEFYTIIMPAIQDWYQAPASEPKDETDGTK